MDRYQAPKKENWKGRIDGQNNAKRFHEVIQCLDLSSWNEKANVGITFGILGFASDEGVSRNLGRKGASEGPSALRRSLGGFPFNFADSVSIIDFGDIVCADQDLESSQRALGAAVNKILSLNIKPIVLGGGHEVAWGNFQGVASSLDRRLNCGIVNFDAHFDIRSLLENQLGSSGTGFLQIAKYCDEKGATFDYTCFGVQAFGNTKALFQKAKELNITTVKADEFFQDNGVGAAEIAKKIVARRDQIYLTICLDAFGSGFAPGVSAPQSLGIYPWHALPIIREFAASGKVVSLDIAELNPSFDRDGMTSHLGASLIAHFIKASTQDIGL